ncbi:hypothetical protein D3C71_2152220 [compost metagenome]
MMDVDWPRTNRKSGSMSSLVITTVWGSRILVRMLAKLRLSLLVLFSPAARSKENFTASAVNGTPLWKVTPLRSLNV